MNYSACASQEKFDSKFLTALFWIKHIPSTSLNVMTGLKMKKAFLTACINKIFVRPRELFLNKNTKRKADLQLRIIMTLLLRQSQASKRSPMYIVFLIGSVSIFSLEIMIATQKIYLF